MTRYTPLWLQSGSYPASLDRDLLSALWPAPASTGLAVTAVAGTMTLNIAPGKFALPVANGGTALCVSDAIEQVTLPPAPGAGLNRWDVVFALARGTDIDGGVNNDFIFTVLSGAPAASPVYPAGPANAQWVATVYVAGGSASIDPASITNYAPGGLAVPSATAAPRGTVLSTAGPSTAWDGNSGFPWAPFLNLPPARWYQAQITSWAVNSTSPPSPGDGVDLWSRDNDQGGAPVFANIPLIRGAAAGGAPTVGNGSASFPVLPVGSLATRSINLGVVISSSAGDSWHFDPYTIRMTITDIGQAAG